MKRFILIFTLVVVMFLVTSVALFAQTDIPDPETTTVLEKILFTLSGAIGIIFVWFVVAKAKMKAFLDKVRKASADGSIDAEEALGLFVSFFDLFRKG